MKNKKAQSLGPTFVSIPVTFLVLFILAVFLVIAIFMSLNKGEIEVVAEKGEEHDLALMNTLMSIMDMPVESNGEEVAVRGLVVEWFLAKGKEKEAVRKKVEEEAEKVLKEIAQERECYIFRAGQGSEYLEVSSFPDSADPRLEKYIESLLDKAVVLYIISGNEKIEIGLSLGDEKC